MTKQPYSLVMSAFATAALAFTSAASATITLNQVSGSNWTIGNGDLNVVFNPSKSNITSVKLAGDTTNLLDPGNSQIYPEFAGTPFGGGTQTSGFKQTSDYIDFWTTTASTGTSTNPITYSFHYVMFNDDPNIVTYEVLNHSATDPATSVGQGQFLARVNPDLFNNTFQLNVGPNNPGPQTSTLADASALSAAGAQPGRKPQKETTDLTGTSIAGDWGGNFYTKYDYSSYTQFLQANTEFGSNYSVSAIFTSPDTMTGGPTKQNLQFTNNIAMIEFLSGHYGDSNYSYTPPQGVDSSRLFGPYDFRFVATENKSGAQLESDAIASMAGLQANYDTDAELIANGYISSANRGSLQISATNPAGWNSNTNYNTVVLSDPHTNFQESSSGYQYWAQLSPGGTATISGAVPGTYRLSLYDSGQWGETRVDGVQVVGKQVMMPQNLKFTPENFGAAPPIWTIGTPDRSAHEFLNGLNTNPNDGVTPGGDLRQFYGNYDYWAEEAALGNPGKVVYYATAVGSTPATNDPQKWIANQWGKFDPGLYDPSNGTTDNYNNTAPQYVKDGGGPASYGGSPWDVNFDCTQAQMNQGKYVVLSVGLAAAEASLVVTLNGHQEIWHYSGNSDPMIRSGDAGFYQFLVFQFPVSDLNAPGTMDQFTFGVSQTDGVMYDALRMEITNTSAAPGTTGWYDYEYITGSNSQISADNSIGQTLTETAVPEPSALLILGLPLLARRARHPGRK